MSDVFDPKATLKSLIEKHRLNVDEQKAKEKVFENAIEQADTDYDNVIGKAVLGAQSALHILFEKIKPTVLSADFSESLSQAKDLGVTQEFMQPFQDYFNAKMRDMSEKNFLTTEDRTPLCIVAFDFAISCCEETMSQELRKIIALEAQNPLKKEFDAQKFNEKLQAVAMEALNGATEFLTDDKVKNKIKNLGAIIPQVENKKVVAILHDLLDEGYDKKTGEYFSTIGVYGRKDKQYHQLDRQIAQIIDSNILRIIDEHKEKQKTEGSLAAKSQKPSYFR